MKIYKKIFLIFIAVIFIFPLFSLLPVSAQALEGNDVPDVVCCRCTDTTDSSKINCYENIDSYTCKELKPYANPSTATCEPLTESCDTLNGCPQFSGSTKTAQEAALNLEAYRPILQVSLGPNKWQFNAVSCSPGQPCTIPWLSQYIGVVYQYLVGLAAMLAAIVAMVGGFFWLTSAGSQERVKKAKDLITGALLGLLLALFSYLILFTINPELIANKPITINMVKPLDISKMTNKMAPSTQTAQTQAGVSGTPAAGCPDAGQAASGFPALITHYCHPKRQEFKSDLDYCCAAAMECACASGSTKYDTGTTCSNGVHPCSNCDPTGNTPICGSTSSGQPPSSDLVAADQSCFKNGTQLCIGGSNYTVGDSGGAIKGSHFDLWAEDCADANTSQTVNVTAGVCP